MKIDKSIIKSIYPSHRKVTVKLISDLGLDCVYGDDYCITDANKFINNFWNKLSEQQKTGLFLSQFLECDNTIISINNRLRYIEDRLDRLRITTEY